MTLVGFKRAKIQVYDKDGKPVAGQKYVVEGAQNKGATSTAEITGLSKEATTVAGSNITYYISRRGTGEVKVNLGLLDFPEGASDVVLGYKKDGEDGITYIGEDTEAPYVGIILESENLQGDKAELAFYKGTFSREQISLKTLDPKENFTPEADAYVFSAISSDAEGEQKGQTVGKYVGAVDSPAFAKLEAQIFGEPAPAEA